VTSTTARDYHLLLPAGWARVQLDDRVDERVVTIAEVQVRDLRAQDREPARRALVRVLRTAVREAADAGSTDLLLSLGAVNGVRVAASCLVTYLPARGLGLDAVHTELAGEGGDVSIVAVAGARAVRRQVRRDVPYDEAGARALAVEAGFAADDVARLRPGTVAEVGYFVPLPGSGDLLAFTFSTPQPELADALTTLFDAIMSTMRWLP
jgi:hypothetical protein